MTMHTLERIYNSIMDTRNPLVVWVLAFALIFAVAFALFLVLWAPLALLLGWTWKVGLFGAIGCGLGTALVNATFMALNS